jgi:hypothetical protein
VQLAAMVRAHQTSISVWENGRSRPSPANRARLEAILTALAATAPAKG